MTSNGNGSLDLDARCDSNGSTNNGGGGGEIIELEGDMQMTSRLQQPHQEQRYLLRWHRHAPTITDHLPNIFEKGLFADVTLTVDGQSLKAHRLILASCSSYFLQIFQEADRNNIEHPYVVLLNAHLEDIQAILNFIYKGECCVYKNRIPELLATAKNLKVSGLSDMQLNDYVLPHLKPEPTDGGGGINQPPPQQQQQQPALLPFPPQHNTHPQNQSKTGNNRDVPETCKCFVCGKYLSNQYNLRVHMETHDETYHACSSCPHVSRSRDALRKHMSYRHPDKYNARKHKRANL